jgi:hypothetical protein
MKLGGRNPPTKIRSNGGRNGGALHILEQTRILAGQDREDSDDEVHGWIRYNRTNYTTIGVSYQRRGLVAGEGFRMVGLVLLASAVPGANCVTEKQDPTRALGHFGVYCIHSL